MRIDGQWAVDDLGVTYPFIPARIQNELGEWMECPFILDTAAERTVIAAEVVGQLGFPLIHSNVILSGVGGLVRTYRLPTRIELSPRGGNSIAINGPFVGSVESSLQLSVLGRDVLANFAVIVDRPGNTVCLLHGRHRYVIQET